MVWLSKTLMALRINDKDFCWFTWLKPMCIEVWVLILFLSNFERAYVWLKGCCIMKWIEKTMLWLGEGCSSYEHDKCLCVWCIKEWVSNGFACLCALSAKMIWWYLKCYELLLYALKSSLLLKIPRCHSRTNVPK